MMINKAYILMDVGGTFIKSGLMSADGSLLENSQQTTPVNSDGTRKEICESLKLVVRQGVALCHSLGYTPSGIGISIPGPFNYITGVSWMDHKFAAIKDVPLREVLSEALDGQEMPIVFGHDVNTQLYGEIRRGNATGYNNVCLVALGTGFGFALSQDKTVLQTATGAPLVSLWKIPYKDGILEDYASKRGFYKTWEAVTGSKPAEDITVAKMGLLAGEGDPVALEVFRRVGSFIGRNIKSYLSEYHIECLLFGGQISRSFRFMEESVRKELEEIDGLKITTVSDFCNAAFKGLAEMLKTAGTDVENPAAPPLYSNMNPCYSLN